MVANANQESIEEFMKDITNPFDQVTLEDWDNNRGKFCACVHGLGMVDTDTNFDDLHSRLLQKYDMRLVAIAPNPTRESLEAALKYMLDTSITE